LRVNEGRLDLELNSKNAKSILSLDSVCISDSNFKSDFSGRNSRFEGYDPKHIPLPII